MILGDLIGLTVRESGRRVGRVNDVRLVAAPAGHEVLGETRVFGLLVSPHGHGSSLGYERTGVGRPVLIAALARWHHRGTFLVRWQDIERLDASGVTLKAGYYRYSPALPADGQ